MMYELLQKKSEMIETTYCEMKMNRERNSYLLMKMLHFCYHDVLTFLH